MSTKTLTEFYSARYNWRNAGEERMRFRKATQLAQVRPGSAVLDIGSRNGDLRRYLPADVKYQGLDIAPEFAAKDILIHDITVPNPYHVKEIIWNLFRVADKQGHIYSWTRQTITRLGEMNGFRLQNWGGTYFYPPIPAPWMLARSVAYKFVKT